MEIGLGWNGDRNGLGMGLGWGWGWEWIGMDGDEMG